MLDSPLEPVSCVATLLIWTWYHFIMMDFILWRNIEIHSEIGWAFPSWCLCHFAPVGMSCQPNISIACRIYSWVRLTVTFLLLQCMYNFPTLWELANRDEASRSIPACSIFSNGVLASNCRVPSSIVNNV